MIWKRTLTLEQLNQAGATCMVGHLGDHDHPDGGRIP
ncbi:Uncharacterised protein [Edwardsiella tarda]|nr:Uncharacterised protein [Edwardsiella tarda]